MNTQQALQLAFQHLNGGNLGAAAQLFNNVLQQEPQNFAALNGRGLVALQQNGLSQSASDFQQSLAINPQQVFAQKMLGIVLGAMGRFDESMQAFASAILLVPKDPEIYFNRANFRFQAGQYQEALADLNESIRLKPSYLEARSNRANLLMLQHDYAQALKDLLYLTDKIKNNPDLWVALGLAQHKTDQYQKALQSNERALKLNTQHPDALMNQSSITFDLQDFEAAERWGQKSVAATPERAESWYSLAKAQMELAQFDLAHESYDRALALNPQYAEAYMGRGLVKVALRDMTAAMLDYEKAIRLKPDYDDAVFNKSYAYLEHRDFVQGWEGYEYRLGFPKFKDSLLPDIPVWQGVSLKGTLLVRGEQGLGDQILFASVLPDLLRVHQNICLQVDSRLVPLFQRSFLGINVQAKASSPPVDCVAQIPLGSLPKLYRRSLADFSQSEVPYLRADAKKTEEYRELLSPNGERIIGVNWRSLNNRFAINKSIQLKDLEVIFKTPNCVFVNLQYGDTKSEIAAVKKFGIQFSQAVSIDLTNDIDSLASLVDACDEIVSVSNSTVHIAGALGKQVLLMLPYRSGKLWYWSEAKGEGSLWYPSIRTFHQSAQGDWASTIDAVKKALVEKV